MQLSENIDDAMESHGKSNQDFIEHSLKLMRQSLENKKIVQEGDV
jgi:transcription elongation GreA/GreB family factor